MFINKNSNKIIQVSLLAIVGATLLVSCKNGSSSSDDSQQNSSDNQAKLELNLIGKLETKVNTSKEVIMIVQNKGKEPASNIVISEIEEPFSIVDDGNECNQKILNPSDYCRIKLKYKPDTVESSEKAIVLNYTNENGSKLFTNKMDVNYLSRGNAELSISPIYQLAAAVGKEADTSFTITNTGKENVKGIEISDLTSPLSIESNNCPVELPIGESCNVGIKLSPSEIKSGSEKLNIEYIDTLAPNKLNMQVPVPYSGFGEVQVKLEGNKDFLIANKGQQITREITLKNEGTGSAKSVQVVPVANPLSIINDKCSGKELGANKTCTFELKFAPNSSSNDETVDIKVDFIDKTKPQQISAPISYKPIDKDILNLSQYQIATSNIEIDTSCSKKDIYGNGSHNIPLTPNFTATDSEGNPVVVSTSDLINSTEIQVRDGGRDYPIPVGQTYNSNKTIASKTSYSKCVDSSNTSMPSTGIFFQSQASGQKIVLGAKVRYIDKSAKITTLNTPDSGRVSINVLQNPLSSAGTSSLFSIWIDSDDYSGGTVVRDNYRLFKITPNTSTYSSLENIEISKIRLTNRDTNTSPGIKDVSFTETQGSSGNKYLMPLAGFDQPAGGTGESKRRFHSGYFISGKLKPSSIYNVWLSKKISTSLSLNSIGTNDFALASISYSNLPGYVWKYMWHVPFSLEMWGTDNYGNSFEAIVYDNM